MENPDLRGFASGFSWEEWMQMFYKLGIQSAGLMG